MSLRGHLENLATGVLVVCALTMTAIVVHREFAPPPDPNAPRPPRKIAEWKQYATGDMQIGPTSAPVTIVEFSDFQCPFCHALFLTLEKMRTSHPGQLRIVYRNFPLSLIHPYARPAAIAAECAASQGQFVSYHDFLFAHQDSLSKLNWTHVAAAAGVSDTVRYARCLAGPDVVAQLTIDSVAGTRLQLAGTPTVMMGPWLFSGTPSLDILEKYFQDELKDSQSHD